MLGDLKPVEEILRRGGIILRSWSARSSSGVGEKDGLSAFQVEVEEQATKVHLRSLDCQDIDTSRLEGSDSSEACRVCLPRCLPRRHAEEG